jgi:hypothetical protein
MKNATGFPTLLETFFTKRLIAQRRVSPNTITPYRDTFRLLFLFAQKQLAKAPSKLTIEDLNAPFLGAFLDDLESTRTNGPDPQSSLDSDPFVLPVCGAGNTTALRSNPARTRDS